MVNKLTLVVFTGGNRPPGSALFSTGQNWYDLPAYTSETIGGDHVRRFVCGQIVQTESCTKKRSLCCRDSGTTEPTF